MKKILYDIECYRNYFCVGFKDYQTKEITFYEISEERNDLDLIYNWFISYTGFLISFNGIHYDNLIVKYLMQNYHDYKNLDYSNITADLKHFSDRVIASQNYQENDIKKVKYVKVGWIDIDLFLYWAKSLRMSKMLSLKALGIQLGYHTVQELPYHHNSVLTKDQLPILRYYNYTHDLGILELLTKAQEEEIVLRHNIVKDYGLDCWSWDAPKIASEALLKEYCKMTGKNLKQVRDSRHEKPVFYLREVLVGFDPKFEMKIFQDLFEEIKNTKSSFSKDLLVDHGDTKLILTYGNGGLHAVNKDEQYYSTSTHAVMTSDVESLYPTFIINYGCIRYKQVLDQYINIKAERVIAKKSKQKVKDKFFKLILNGISGLIDMEHSWLYFHEGAMRLRLIGQLVLTKCIEVCLLNGWKVISANTDGIEVIVPIQEVEKYQEVLDETIKLFNAKLEHEQYEKIIYKNVSAYIAVTVKGKIKRKGFFKLSFDEDGNREIPLGDGIDEQVIAKALNAYYTQDINPEEFIRNPDKYNISILDFCKSNKIGKDFTVYHNGKKQQQLNRYYFSKNGPYLFKRKHDVGTFQHVNVGYGVKLYNNHEEKEWKDYDVNYSYYIRAVQDIIDEINRLNQMTLF